MHQCRRNWRLVLVGLRGTERPVRLAVYKPELLLLRLPEPYLEAIMIPENCFNISVSNATGLATTCEPICGFSCRSNY